MRFGVEETPELAGRCRVTLDGADVTDGCLRGEDGPDGWVETIVQPPSVVDDELVTQRRTGAVAVEVSDG